MRKHLLALSVIISSFLLATPRLAAFQDSSAAYKLQVHVNYTGAGTVDDKHKIYVVLWDSPKFASGEGGSMPLAIQPATSKDGTVSFDNITNTPVYISAAYDPSGQWDAHSSPPDGSSLGMYSDDSGQPKAVELKPGKTTKVDLAFDDRMKMNGGKPAPAQ